MKFKKTYPRVAILMATYNGADWLQDQIDSLFKQQQVNVSIFISDDGSVDGTYELLQKLSLIDGRVVLLDKDSPTGSASKNFYRLIRDVDFTEFDYIAFADQDDIWNLDKIFHQICLIERLKLDAVSSDVIAFWPDGTERILIKSQPQKRWDFIFESAGPGCTFLVKPWILELVRNQILDQRSMARFVEFHDWLIYAIARSVGARWLIDSKPTLKYRQHQNNVMGANLGLKTKFKRFLKIRAGWYRSEIIKLSQISRLISCDAGVRKINELTSDTSIMSNIKLIRFVSQSRRSFCDRFWLLILLVSLSF